MKHSKEAYLSADPFMDYESDVKYLKKKLVRVRREHDCMCFAYVGEKPHKIQIGEMARLDSAMVDGEWGRCYSCLPCLDKWLKELMK